MTRPSRGKITKATMSLNLGFSGSWVALMSSVSTLSGEVTGAARKCKLPSQADGRSKVRSSKTEIKAASPASLSARPNQIKFQNFLFTLAAALSIPEVYSLVWGVKKRSGGRGLPPPDPRYESVCPPHLTLYLGVRN